MLDQQVKVTGFVVFQYDLTTCARDLGEKLVKQDPKLCEGKKDIVECTNKVADKAVAETPDQCERPVFLPCRRGERQLREVAVGRRGAAPAARRREA